MSFALSAHSHARLKGVHPDLAAAVRFAIQLTTHDFIVHDGVRTLARQRQMVAAGASRTLRSRHLVQPDGFGHAVDLVPYIGGKVRWEWKPLYAIAAAMREAAIEWKVDLIWGGVWDRHLAYLPETAAGLEAAVKAYCARHPGPDFIDGPHFEIAS
ncbi:MAG: M15 family metallopeptidase [Brevundimonas sp.]